MSTFVIIIHVLASLALILIVLLQTGKGADMGAAFGGGGGQTLFGSTGASTFLSRLTTIAAIIFMITSLVLAYVSSHRSTKSVMTQMAPPPVTEQHEHTHTAVPAKPEETQSQAPAQPLAQEGDVVKSPDKTTSQQTDTAKKSEGGY